MWAQSATDASTEFRVLLPNNSKGLREGTARRVTESDEAAQRHCMEKAEASARLQLFNDRLLLHIASKLRAFHYPALRCEDEWEQRTRSAFEVAEGANVEIARRLYSAFSDHWMPHDILRPLHEDWRRYFAKWKKLDPSAVPSSLLSSFFAGILVDETLSEDDAIGISSGVINSCLEVANDEADDAVDAVPYHTFVHLVQTIALQLFAPKHPYVATHLLSVVLQERVHRIH